MWERRVGIPEASMVLDATVIGDGAKATAFGYDTGALMVDWTAPVLSYVRDATDRIVTRKLSGVISAKYAYTASADSPSLTLNSSGAVIERTISLPGGVVVTTRGATASDVWSYPNIHGDIIATANGSGIKTGATRGYDPFGNLLGTSTTPDNSAGPFDYGWHGQQQRPLEYQTGFTPLIEMGARQYSSLLGRFLETDPVLGGNANDYAYVSDPIAMSDLDGLCGVWGNPRRRCHSNHRGASSFGNWVGHGIRRGRNYAEPRARCLTARGYCSARFKSENRTVIRLGNEVRSSISVTGCVYACASVNGWGKVRWGGLGVGRGPLWKSGVGLSANLAIPGTNGPTAGACYWVCASSNGRKLSSIGVGTPGISYTP